MGKTTFRPLPAVLARVETCERENARLKRIGAVVLLVATAGLLCALSAGGQQKAKSGNTSGCKLGDTWEPNCYETLVRARPTVGAKLSTLLAWPDTFASRNQRCGRASQTQRKSGRPHGHAVQANPRSA